MQNKDLIRKIKRQRELVNRLLLLVVLLGVSIPVMIAAAVVFGLVYEIKIVGAFLILAIMAAVVATPFLFGAYISEKHILEDLIYEYEDSQQRQEFLREYSEKYIKPR